MDTQSAAALTSCALAVRLVARRVLSGKHELATGGLQRAEAQARILARGRPAHAKIARVARTAVEKAREAIQRAVDAPGDPAAKAARAALRAADEVERLAIFPA